MPTTRDGDLIVLPPETLAQICRHYRRLGLSSLLIHAPPDARRQVLVRVVRGAISRSVVEDDGERWVVAPRFPRGRLRLPLVMKYVAGSTNQQIADALGISVSNVKVRLAQAKDVLANRLERILES